MLIPVEVGTFGVDSATGEPVVVLKASDSGRTLAVVIGSAEAAAIAMKSLNVASEGPLTVDLVKTVVGQLGGSVDKVVIHDVVHHAFLARLHIVVRSGARVIECRPSDAIALAVRCGAPMFVEDKVFEKAGPSHDTSEAAKLRRSLADMDTLDFGQYFVE